MIIIYTQDETFIRENADAAKDVLCSVYGEKLGLEAYKAINYAHPGATYRKHSGPLVQVIDKEKAAVIKEKETAIGMM